MGTLLLARSNENSSAREALTQADHKSNLEDPSIPILPVAIDELPQMLHSDEPKCQM